KYRYTTLQYRIALIDILEHADPPHPLGLLRMRNERPHSCGADKPDEISPLHVPSVRTMLCAITKA
ncbi:MAG: hypothetical protein WCD87_21760, partial [Pseudolabrys sp.]